MNSSFAAEGCCAELHSWQFGFVQVIEPNSERRLSRRLVRLFSRFKVHRYFAVLGNASFTIRWGIVVVPAGCIPLLRFMLAQGAKRYHDTDNSAAVKSTRIVIRGFSMPPATRSHSEAWSAAFHMKACEPVAVSLALLHA